MSTSTPLRPAVAAAAACALLGGLAAASPAQADKARTSAAPARHCAVNAGTGQAHCYPTFRKAIATASHGRVTNAPASAARAMHSHAFRARMRTLGSTEGTRSADGSAQKDGVVQGTFFDDRDFGGDSLTVYGKNLCKDDDKVEYQYDLGDDWKNRISSVQPWGDCWVWLYPQPGLGGDRDGPFKDNTGDIGTAMNDRTQSIGFS